jgi:hypothetical protein
VIGDIPAGERTQAFFLGQYPSSFGQLGLLSINFPEGMATDAMFPEETAVYTDPDSGMSYVVPCYIPGADASANLVACPHPFVSDAAGEKCIQPCPVPAYTEAQYRTMWTLSSAVSMGGFAMNLFMALTWCVGGRKSFRKVCFQLKSCVMGGILYGLVYIHDRCFRFVRVLCV